MAYGVSLLLASNLLPAFMKRYGAPVNIALFYWVTGPNLPHIQKSFSIEKKTMILTTNLLRSPMIKLKPEVCWGFSKYGLILHVAVNQTPQKKTVLGPLQKSGFGWNFRPKKGNQWIKPHDTVDASEIRWETSWGW